MEEVIVIIIVIIIVVDEGEIIKVYWPIGVQVYSNLDWERRRWRLLAEVIWITGVPTTNNLVETLLLCYWYG